MLHQRRNNFKDPSSVACGGALFSQTLAAADASFRSLPPPTPSLHPPPVLGVPARSGGGGGGGVPTYVATVSADEFERSFNDARGGCFAPSCFVSCPDPDNPSSTILRAAGDLRRGDAVRCGRGAGDAAVDCVVRFDSPSRVVTLPGGGPTLTPWHPVWLPHPSAPSPHAGEWDFPARVCARSQSGRDANPPHAPPAPAVVSFVLSRGGTVVVDGVVCACLGHGA